MLNRLGTKTSTETWTSVFRKIKFPCHQKIESTTVNSFSVREKLRISKRQNVTAFCALNETNQYYIVALHFFKLRFSTNAKLFMMLKILTECKIIVKHCYKPIRVGVGLSFI